MKTMLLAVFLFFSAGNSVFAEDSLCKDVLSPEVFNAGETTKTVYFASKFKDTMCKEEWKSEDDARSRAGDFHLSYADIVGIGSSDQSQSHSLKEDYNNLCHQTIEDIAYSTRFFNKYRSSDFAVNAWKECVDHASEGHFLSAVPDQSLTGAAITLRIKTSATIPHLIIKSVEPSGAYDVKCYVGDTIATSYNFDDNITTAAIHCIKRADVSAEFVIDTTWGTFKSIKIPGYSATIMELQQSIAEIRQKSLRSCRVCFHAEGPLDQCQGAKDTCSGYAQVGQENPQWTDYFLDDTDNRSGGCKYQWRLICGQ